MTSQLWWYLARAAGIVSWALVAISVCWGLLLAGRPIPGRSVGWARPHRLLDLHRYLGALAVVFTGIHVGALIADSYVHFDVVGVLVPFAVVVATGRGRVGGRRCLAAGRHRAHLAGQAPVASKGVARRPPGQLSALRDGHHPRPDRGLRRRQPAPAVGDGGRRIGRRRADRLPGRPAVPAGSTGASAGAGGPRRACPPRRRRARDGRPLTAGRGRARGSICNRRVA